MPKSQSAQRRSASDQGRVRRVRDPLHDRIALPRRSANRSILGRLEGIVQIDLNSDLGEGYGPWMMGDDRAMLDVVTSANIACGGHAGDTETMFETVARAVERGEIGRAHV